MPFQVNLIVNFPRGDSQSLNDTYYPKTLIQMKKNSINLTGKEWEKLKRAIREIPLRGLVPCIICTENTDILTNSRMDNRGHKIDEGL